MLSALAERGPGPGRGSDGFTLIELVVSMSILMVVLGALVGGMATLFNTEKRSSTHITDEQSARFVMDAVTRDLRAANPVLPQTALSTYHSTADVLTGPAGSGQVHLRWTYDGVGTLRRWTVNADGTTSLSGTYPGIVNGAGVPVFSWIDRLGQDLTAPGLGWATVGDVARCATSVQVTLVVDSRPSVPAITETSQVALGNQASLQGCP